MFDIILKFVHVQNNTFGRTLGFYHNQVWQRSEIIKALNEDNYQNNTSPVKETVPVRDFNNAFGNSYNGNSYNIYSVKHDDVLYSIRKSSKTFTENQRYFIEIASYYIKK